MNETSTLADALAKVQAKLHPVTKDTLPSPNVGSAPDRLRLRLVAKLTYVPSGCLLFSGAKAVNGYGRIALGGKAEGSTAAHRVAYELFVGPIPPGLDLDHLCRVRECCNPLHLEPTTRRLNIQRAAAVKTHCTQGHPLPPYDFTRRRRCIPCQRERDARRSPRRRDVA